jgi:HPt (histidine-containing phosphotransfer) domain-containing protein
MGDDSRRFAFGGKRVTGADLDKALARFGGEAALLQILRAFAAETPMLLEKIRNPDRENLSCYAITVHGIKSSSRNIYAEQVGGKAEALEHAAKAGDFDFVRANNDSFIAAAEECAAAMKALLQEIDSKQQKPVKDAPESAVLSRLRQACLEFDIDKVDEAVAEIAKYRYTSGQDLVDWLGAHAATVDFQKIADKLAPEK